MKNVAVLFAGGIGKRMNSGDVPKQFLEVFGIPGIASLLRTLPLELAYLFEIPCHICEKVFVERNLHLLVG